MCIFSKVIQHYSFVLTDIESKWTFGFCRHDPRSETALVVLSYLPWHHAFYKYDYIYILYLISFETLCSQFRNTYKKYVFNHCLIQIIHITLVDFNRLDKTT